MWVVLCTLVLSGDIIPEANSCQRNEAEIQRLQKVPGLLQADKDPCRDDEEEHGDDDGKADGMNSG